MHMLLKKILLFLLRLLSNQEVNIDLRGQNVSDEVLTKLYTEITQKTNGGVSISFKVK